MLRIMHKSKIHNVTVTEANLSYKGSVTIDETLMKEADILENEKVLIVNTNNGERFETYSITGKKDSGVICLNGAAARLAHEGDKIIIISFGLYSPDELKDFTPRVLFPDEQNKI